VVGVAEDVVYDRRAPAMTGCDDRIRRVVKRVPHEAKVECLSPWFASFSEVPH